MLGSVSRVAFRSAGARSGVRFLVGGSHSSHHPKASPFLSSARRSHHSENDSYENILVETKSSEDGQQPGVGIVTLNRPKALNALSSQLFAELLHATEAMEEDPSIGCMIVTGSPKAFAAGADIAEMQSKTFEENALNDWIASWHDLANRRPTTPIIAAVSGFCLGGGCELAMMCDFIVCDSTAKFGQPEINLGVIAGAGGTQRLTKLIGRSKSMYMNLTGEFLSAEEAYTSGLVAKVYDNHDDLMENTLKMANKIAGKGRMSVKACKEAVKAAEELPLQEGLRLERRLFHSLFATEDQKEGMKAFVEKRKPNFTKYH